MTVLPPSTEPPEGFTPVTTGSSSKMKLGRTSGSIAVAAAAASSNATVIASCSGASHNKSADDISCAGPMMDPNLHLTSSKTM